MIRRDLQGLLQSAAEGFPAVTLTGPRQSGKSTLCRAAFPDLPYADLEAPDVRAFALEDPRGFLSQHPEGAILDEIQRCPDLPSYLQVMIDADPRPGRWILSGSQNLALLGNISQSLAGRTAILNLLPLTRSEVRRFPEYPTTLEDAMVAGGYPRIFDRRLSPADWLSAYIAMYVERDVRAISNIGDLTTFQRFLELCAGRTAQLLNLSSLAADCGISQPTARAWLSVLEASFVVFRLPAYSTNLRKRLVKMPKLHFVDTGVACWLLGIRNGEQLRSHPLRGALFETWAASEILKHRYNRGESRGLLHFRAHNGEEADLVLERAESLQLIEMKSTQTASEDVFRGIRRVRDLLSEVRAARAMVVYGGTSRQERGGVTLVPWDGVDEQDWA